MTSNLYSVDRECIKSHDATNKLARFVHDLQMENLSGEFIEHAVHVVRDTLRTMLAVASCWKEELCGMPTLVSAGTWVFWLTIWSSPVSPVREMDSEIFRQCGVLYLCARENDRGSGQTV